MDQERLPSFLLSLCLHLGIFALILLWPASDPPLRDYKLGLTIEGYITIGAPGATNPKAALAGTMKDIPKKTVVEKQPEPPVKDVPQVEKQPEPQKTVEKQPEVDPDAVKIKKDEQEKKPPTKNATDTKQPEKKPDKQPEKKPDKKPPTKNATDTKQPEKQPDKKPEKKPDPKKDALDKALADLKSKNTSPDASTQPPGSLKDGKAGSLSNALEDLGNEVGGSGDGDYGIGPGGSGGDGIGIRGSYAESLISRVRPNWRWVDRADRKTFAAVVNIKIDTNGEITAIKMIKSSGNPLFDSTLENALKATKTLEPPPTPAERDIDITFTSDMLGR